MGNSYPDDVKTLQSRNKMLLESQLKNGEQFIPKRNITYKHAKVEHTTQSEIH